MYDTKPDEIELQEAFPLARVHPSWCDCAGCRLDVMSARRERIIRAEAALLAFFLVALYALAILCLPQILASFGWRI